MQKEALDVWIIDPMKRFMNNSTASGIVLFGSAMLAFVLANSPVHESFHHLWEMPISISIGKFNINNTLHHWINDGLMAIFFFVVGLELKRELLTGELNEPKKALLPIGAALGGMIVPALIYVMFNTGRESLAGWGIPMATDIAFALGVLYLLGDRVPVALKVFLTALAIADDIGAVLVIAFFYTSDVNTVSLLTGAGFMAIMMTGNWLGVRNVLFYAFFGIGGLWLAFLMSGVHATIAGVLAAATIPATIKVPVFKLSERLTTLAAKLKATTLGENGIISDEQLHIIDSIENTTINALSPLQRLEHSMHPLVAFIIMPVFALSNAGVTLSGNWTQDLFSPVAMGVFSGLLLGKVIGAVGSVALLIGMGWAVLPEDVTKKHILGAGFLAAIGFTMSLFINNLAFVNPRFVLQAKLAILVVSVVASLVGFTIIRSANSGSGTDGKKE